MQAIIIAGGRGERLKPLTNTVPKPMIKVCGKPILEQTLNLLKAAGINEFIFALCYLPEVVTNYFGDGSKFGVHIEYTYEDPGKPLGTAGAITLAKDRINETFLVTYADILRELDVKAMLTTHKANRAFATINIYKRFGQNPKSMVMFDRNCRITAFIERPETNQFRDTFVWANGSFYFLEPSIFDYIPMNVSVDFGSFVFPKLVNDGKLLYAYQSTGYFIDIGTLEKLKKAQLTFRPPV